MAEPKPQRSCLPPGTPLTIVAENGNRYQLTIKDTISNSGGSCIVYHGTYHIELGINPDVIVKEFFPQALSLTRSDSGALEICEAERALFEERAERFHTGLTNHITQYEHYKRYITPPPLAFGRANNTICAIYGHSEGTVLSKLPHSTLSLWDVLSLMQRLCQIAFDLHTDEKVYLDFKPENVYTFHDKYDWDVKLFDFDTLVSEEEIRNRKAPCAFTPAWAAPEQIPPEGASYYAAPYLVGFHSDIFSLGLIFYWMLTGRTPSADSRERQAMSSTIRQGTVNWPDLSPMCAVCTPEQNTEIRMLLAKMLEPDVGQRRKHFSSIAQKKKLTKKFQALRDSVPRPCAPVPAPPRPDTAHKGEVPIPWDATEIGPDAFRCRADLKDVLLPGGVQVIGSSAFSCCLSLRGITIPERVTQIGAYAFMGCCALAAVMLPEHMAEIGRSAFESCTALTGITLPAGLTKISDYTFARCSSLLHITVPAGVTEIGWSAFAHCSAMTSITIPAGVTEIGAYAFEGCTSLVSITLPKSVTEIGRHAFRGCTALEYVDCPEQLFTQDNFGDTQAWRTHST